MFVLGKVLSTAAVLLCILCLAAPLKKTKAGQKIKGLRILLKPHVLYGWLLLVIGLMHGIMAGKNPGMISGKLGWMGLLVLLLAACLKSRMKKSVWMFLHRSLSVVFAAGIVFHIAYAVIF